MITDSLALNQTRAWVEHAVIGLNLCPFAKAPQVKGLVRYVESLAQDPAALLSPFNHVITYVPGLNLYLDSTARFAPMGALPDEVMDKPVLQPARSPEQACEVAGDLSCHGYGSTVTVTATFGLVAASVVMEQALALAGTS